MTRLPKLLVCGACVGVALTVAIAVVFAVGIELVQKEKQRDWREAMS